MLDDRLDCTPFLRDASPSLLHPFCTSIAQTESGELLCLGLAAGPHRVLLTNQGARLLVWQSDVSPNIVVGPRTAREILQDQGAMGVSVGRVCNRIAKGELPLHGQQALQLPCNDGSNHLHGGPQGFHQKLWELAGHRQTKDEAEASFTLFSPAGDQGYPGAVRCRATYHLTASGELTITYQSEVFEASTPLNLTHHAYWNLNPDEGNSLTHSLQSDCDRYLITDLQALPSGEIASVTGTLFDFRKARTLGPEIPPAPHPSAPAGYDVFLIRPDELTQKPQSTWRRLARLQDAKAQRELELWSDQWGFQLYSGNYLSAPYGQWQGICMEPSGLIDAVHHPQFPSIWVKPGESLRQTMQFCLRDDKGRP